MCSECVSRFVVQPQGRDTVVGNTTVHSGGAVMTTYCNLASPRECATVVGSRWQHSSPQCGCSDDNVWPRRMLKVGTNTCARSAYAHRDKQTKKQTNYETPKQNKHQKKQTHTHTNTNTETNKHTNTETHANTHTHTHKHTNTQKHKQTNTQTRQTNTQNKQTNKHTNKQTNKQTDKPSVSYVLMKTA